MKCSDQAKKKAYEVTQAERMKRREFLMSRLLKKAEEDPEGPWKELYDESLNTIEKERIALEGV